MRCIQCKGDTRVHKTVIRHQLYVLRTRECLRCGHRAKTLEIHSFMPMAQAVLHVRAFDRCQGAIDHLNKVWAAAKGRAARYNLRGK